MESDYKMEKKRSPHIVKVKNVGDRREIFGSTFLNHQPQWTIKQFVRLVSTKPMNRLLLSGEE